MSIFRFAFWATFWLYTGLLFAEYLRPGFVVNGFNVHWLLVLMILGLIFEKMLGNDRAMGSSPESGIHRIVLTASALLMGIILALIIWHLGDAFGSMRLLFALVVGVVPIILVRSDKLN